VTGAAVDHEAPPLSVATEMGARLWVLVVAGVPTGVVVAGVGSRLAMLMLRLTSPERVRGVTSDDGFEIGRVTMSGTYNLLVLGAGVGVIGAAAYRAVAPWLLGPVWFRRGTVAVASGAVVGSMLVHDGGIDFHVLKPLWLAVGLFVALPAVFGAAIAAMVDRLAAHVPPAGWRGWSVPVALVVAFPLAIPIVVIAALGLAVWVPARRAVAAAGGVPPIAVFAIRSAWAAVALFGAVALVRDLQALT
jgi:hypothetical protein